MMVVPSHLLALMVGSTNKVLASNCLTFKVISETHKYKEPCFTLTDATTADRVPPHPPCQNRTQHTMALAVLALQGSCFSEGWPEKAETLSEFPG